ncbi:hypothetical protein NQ318_008011 [Aromia moschata]|uniref:Uncharacterized protein n=1 Tax=Aromia moschata TaxID=1265417 RepID=A0AAV8XT66_9CUCU|nr:hypothetical protein NQ318_008011 [Aromia moschata]
MAESKKKCRQYSVDYLKFAYSFLVGQAIACAFINKVLSNDTIKPSKLDDHLRRCHPDKRDKVQKRPTMDKMFASTSQRDDDGLRAYYNISLLIAKSGKPHIIGEKINIASHWKKF